MLNKDIQAVVKKYGVALISQVVTQLQSVNKASNRLVNSLKFEVVEASNEISGQLKANEEFKYIITGRAAGKQPPVSDLQQWMESKCIQFNESTAFAIARHIGRFGIPHNDFFSKALQNTKQQLLNDTNQVVREYIKKEIKTNNGF
jgi:hypothetical protein